MSIWPCDTIQTMLSQRHQQLNHQPRLKRCAAVVEIAIEVATPITRQTEGMTDIQQTEGMTENDG